jgi:hypothetical protein
MEIEPKNEIKNWMEYEHKMDELALNGEFNQLEDLLREDHPFLPGELEVYNKLRDNLGREPRVKLDETGMHVIRAEQ